MFEILAPTASKNRLFLIYSRCKTTPIFSSLTEKNLKPKSRLTIINKGLCIACTPRPQLRIIIKASFVTLKPSINKISLISQGSISNNAAIRPTVGQIFPRGVKYS